MVGGGLGRAEQSADVAFIVSIERPRPHLYTSQLLSIYMEVCQN